MFGKHNIEKNVKERVLFENYKKNVLNVRYIYDFEYSRVEIIKGWNSWELK